MTSDRDIYASATLMIKRFGNDAPIEAAQRAEAFVAEGNMEGHAAWMRIMKAAEALLRQRPGPGETIQ